MWRYALQRMGMAISKSKTVCTCLNAKEEGRTVKLQGAEVAKVEEFKYLGMTVQSTAGCGKEIKRRVQAGWKSCTKVTGVICDRKVSAKMKGKVYKTNQTSNDVWPRNCSTY